MKLELNKGELVAGVSGDVAVTTWGRVLEIPKAKKAPAKKAPAGK